MRRVLLILSAIFFYACQQVIDIDISENNDLVVVEAFLSNKDAIHEIRVTRTVSFSSETLAPPIIDADVRVFNTNNEVIQFQHLEDGTYISDSLSIEVADQYRLEVLLANGDTITSEYETLQPAATIDSLHYSPIELPDPQFPRQTIKRFYPVIYGLDDAGKEDYYMWTVYRNDTLFNEPQDRILIEDRFFNGNNFRNEFTSFIFDAGDEIKVEVRMISNNAFTYLSQFKDQAINQNLNQPTSPNRLLGNLQNQSNPSSYVLGVFSIANMSAFEKKIETP